MLMQHNIGNTKRLFLQHGKKWFIFLLLEVTYHHFWALTNTLKKQKNKNQAAYARGLEEKDGNGHRDQCAVARLVASTQGSFHSRVTWDSRLEAPAHQRSGTECASVSPAQPRMLFVNYKISEQAPTSWSALQCSQAPITAERVPFSSGLEVMWSALQGQRYYTHISAQFLEVLAALHSSGEIHKCDIRPLKKTW